MSITRKDHKKELIEPVNTTNKGSELDKEIPQAIGISMTRKYHKQQK